MADNTIDILLNARLNASDAVSGVNEIQKAMRGLTLPKNISDGLEKSFSKLTPLLKDYQKQLNKGFSSQKDIKNFNLLKEKIDSVFGDIKGQINEVNGKKIRLKADTQEIDAVKNKIIKTQADLNNALQNVFKKNQSAASIETVFGKLQSNIPKNWTKVTEMLSGASRSFKAENYAEFNRQLQNTLNYIQKLSNTSQIDLAHKLGMEKTKTDIADAQKYFNNFFNSLKTNVKEANNIELLRNKLKELGIELEGLNIKSIEDGPKAFEDWVGSINDVDNALNQLHGSTQNTAESMVHMVDEINQLKTSTQYFFSLRNMINLFKRGVDDAIESVKELDAAMTETAVVTDFSVGDMWERLPEYTANANALGATVKDMYKSATLYYQQGLEGNEVMNIASETMKMARIGGLEAADATDKMTAALRGFNMEINEASAQRVNDVYSNLAAKTASDTEELGTAMQRTASIAASAGMSFEGTAAFLAQAIETTREPAENLGTAMKTIVARFTELKKNPLEITEVDGEEVDYNKVDAALKTIGVSLKDANGQFRELDQVFLDISQRWDGLTQTQQRYIATTAAGSRQQSRFIAMMSNYERTMQLMDYANNSAGASNEQFGKTMESLEAKLNKFHNAWQAFTMSIANNNLVKWAVDFGTTVLSTTNKIIETLSRGNGVVKSFLSLFTAFTGLRGFGRLANLGLGGLAGAIDPSSSIKEGLKSGLSGFRGNSQTKAITNPIVAAIHGLIPHIDKASNNINGNPYKYQSQGNYKQANEQIKLTTKEGKYTTNGLLDIINSNQLNKQQQRDLFQSVPGLKTNLSNSLSNLFKEIGTDSEVSKGLIQGFKSGDLALDEVLSSKALSPKQLAELMAPKDSASDAEKFIKERLADIQTKAMHDVAEMGLSDEDANSAVEALTEQRWNAITESIPKDKLEEFLASTQELSGVEKFANVVGKIGANLTSAGYSMQMFGNEISKVNPLLGEVISNMGGLLTTAGSLVNILPQILSNPLALAGTVILGAIAFDKYQSKKIQAAAEEVVKTYEETTENITEKVNTLKSAQNTFDELSKGVDKFGNNINLTEEDYASYLETVNNVAAIAPELIRGYDAQGHAILATGSAIDELITKEKELQEVATRDFIDDSSINKIMGGIQESDAFKNNKLSGLAGDAARGSIEYLQKQTQDIQKALAKAKVTNFDEISKQLFGKEINLINPSQDDLRLIGTHYQDIFNLIDSENKELSDKQRDGLKDAFSNLGEGWEAMTGELQPLSQAIGQYLSLEGIDTIGLGLGEEFTSSFNKGLESLSMTAAIENWDASKIKTEAHSYAEGFKAMVQEGSEYANIMEKVTTEQEKYNNSIDNPNAINDYKNAVEGYANEIEALADKYNNGTVAGELFANSLRETANHIRNYATESIISLGEALNTLSDDFESARGAEDRFKKATEKGDYYTAAEGYQNIAKTVLDEKNSAGSGSLTAWAGAEELLGQKFVDSHSWDQIEARIKKIAPMFDDGIEGVQKFGDFLVEAAGESGKELQGLGEVVDGAFRFNFDLEEGEIEKFADKLGIAKDALVALIDKSRQFVPWDVSDPKKVKRALEQETTSMTGTSSKGESLLYTSESHFRQEAYQQGIRGDDYKKTRTDVQNQGVRFLTVENLTAKNQKDGGAYANQVLENIGLSGADKTISNAVAAFAKMGFDLEDTQRILTADGIKLADGPATNEQVAQAYNERAYALENPTVAGIANDTSIIANAATAMLASMGILTEDAKQKIDQSTSDDTIKGIINSLNPEGGFKSSAEHDAAVNQIQSQIADYESTINLLKQSGNEALLPQIEQLENARDQLQSALDQDMDAWQTKLEGAQSYVEGIGQTVQEQQFLSSHAIDIQEALQSSDPTALVNTLQQLQQEGNLSAQTMIDLGASLSHLEDNETYLQALNVLMSDYYEQVKAARNETYQPFTITTKLRGDDLINYVSGIDDLTLEEREILVNTELYGDEKVSAFLDEINEGFDGGNETTKSILIEATTKLANGDTAGANELLQQTFGDQAQEVRSKLDIICDGSIANEGEVKQAIQSQIDSLPIEKQIEVTANVKTTYKDVKPKAQTGIVNYNKGTQAKATPSDTTVNYTKIGTQVNPKPKDADLSYKLKSQENPKDKTAYVTYKRKGNIPEEDAKGRNNTLPAHQSLSFGSAARGMNIPKTKKSSKRSITALVGERGFEVGYIPSEQRSVIFGANGPEMTSFPSDTIIYPHDESQDILRRGKRGLPTFGSFEYGNSGGIPTSGSGSSSGSKKSKKKKKKKKGKKSKSKSKSKSSSKDPTLNLFSIQEVVRFNIDQAISDLNADIEKREKEIEKGLSKIGASYKSISGATKKQISALKQIQTRNQQLLASYQAQLKEYRGQEAYVKWTTNSGESKNKKIKIKDYLNADGSVNQAAISKLGSRAEREAVFKEVSSAKSLVDGIQKAQDEIDKAGDQIEELGKKVTEQFFLWENELTKIYNLTQKINNLNSLSERFASQIALETAKLGAGFGSLSKSIDTIRKVTVRNNDTIGKQIAIQQQMISARQEEMENILRAVNEAKDLEAAWRDNKSDAATKKARVNAAKDNYNAAKIGYGYLKNLKQDLDGSLSYDIDWSQIAKDRTSGKLSKDTYDMVKSYLDNLNDSVAEFNDSIKTQTDTIRDLYEQYTQYQETINDFGGTLLNGLEAIQKEREDDLKKMSTLVSGLGDGMKDLIDQVKRNLDERRNQEDNRKTEADISKKQQRLAALQADTSGGHQVEIAQLQKEIGETQQNYQRTLEDQLLDRLQAQNDEAIKQRERLISISEAQLAIATQNNTELVNLWLKNPEAYKSKIYDAYREAIDFSEKLDIGKQLAKQDFNSQFASVVTAVDQIKIPNHANALTQINSNIINLRGILTQQNSSKTSAQAKVTAKNTGSTATKPTAKATTPKVATPVAPKKAAPKKAAAAPAKKAAPAPKVKTQAEKDAELWEKIKTNFGNLSIDATKAKAGGLGSDALRVAKTHKGDKVYIKGQDAHVGASGEIYWDRKGTIRKWNPSTGQVVKQKYNKKQYIKDANPKNSPYVYEEYRESLHTHGVKGYKNGGLDSETGPAYLHGTPSKPELVLNAQDTKNFIALKDVLSKAVHSSNFASTSYGDATYEININVDKISSDYDVDKMAERVKKIIVSDSSYRNVTQVRKFR